ncbi:MAG: class I SAM-dependent methyltransferase [Actinomycetaceae bacterium]|nr:class I SAM-dependent methyltransferase [Actinomycetaceae bacterium]
MNLSKLLDPDIWGLLRDYEGADPVVVSAALRALDHPGEIAAAVASQVQLRALATAKFPDVTDGLFTRTGIEQATRPEVAALHAKRFRNAGCQLVADLGCGCGADALALAKAGMGVLALEIDENTHVCATQNLRIYPRVQVRLGDATKLDMEALAGEGVDAIFADPARRGPRGRILDPNAWSPPLGMVLSWRGRFPNLGVKVAPGINYASIPCDAQAQWVSVRGEVVEASLWFGALRSGTGRSAVVFDDVGNDHYWCFEGDPSVGAGVAPTAGLGDYIAELDGAALRGGALAWAVENWHGSGLVFPGVAYLWAPTPPPEPVAPFVRTWHVEDVLPLKPQLIRQWLRERQVGVLEIKKRGTDISPQVLRAKVLPVKRANNGTGAKQRSFTLLATRTLLQGKPRHVAVMARPI